MFNHDDTLGVNFFQRLGNEKEHITDKTESIEYVIASIKLNISGLLNTRLGESQSCPELGLFDFNDANSGSFDLGVKIKSGIKICIERFEPRLSHLDVRVLHDSACPFSLRFQILGKINVKTKQEEIEINLFLDSNRMYRVN